MDVAKLEQYWFAIGVEKGKESFDKDDFNFNDNNVLMESIQMRLDELESSVDWDLILQNMRSQVGCNDTVDNEIYEFELLSNNELLESNPFESELYKFGMRRNRGCSGKMMKKVSKMVASFEKGFFESILNILQVGVK